MIIACCLYKYFPYGGLQRDFLRIAQTVETKGHKIRVYVQDWQGPAPDSFEIIKVPVTSITNHGQGEQFATWVAKHMKDHPVDVVVGFNKMPGLDVYYAADICYEEKVSREKHGLKGMLYRLTSRYKHFAAFEKATFNHGLHTKLLMIAKPEIAYFTKHYQTESNRFYLLPPGIAYDRKYSNQPAGTRETFRAQNQIANDQLVLLSVGSDFRRKGVDRSLRAIAALPKAIRDKVIFMVVGQDNPDSFKKLANELGIGAQVRIYAGRDDIPAMMAASDVFLHPAYSENTGTVILEAIVSGLPLIVTGVCGYANHVVDAQCGVALSEPYQQQEFNTELEKLLSDASYRANCVAHAKAYADSQDLYSMTERAAEIILSKH